ncbi:hypothetical protein HN51_012028 [Arachis hypogaea]|nr:pentatricopeptide repeat-containing protein At4g21065 [Arachis hypogaea]XP_025688657.1 pentatricopeptide repeat-containing protein At4g21065 [Arachis hypogaea]XP_025688658.1 pentatricopeptide repeat-containing protein At4g21065 [Arachis hypogaea]XP_029152874.1 pentatricopeptide repeat-containing protein At4g21065 [Arachis hypogaea]XP_029152875.1 pentatricopeptide repeat-containing protein At4g21065 [Arachis hypogaea]QHO57444.1 Pentatricopeptide repeat-containing protein [Arachis hypogaea]
MELRSMSDALQFHAQLLKGGTQNDDAARNVSKLFTFAALSPGGDLSYARLLLRSIPRPNSYYYNTIIRAYSRSPDPTHHFHALSLFLSMLHHQPPQPDNFTYPFLLKCLARLKLTPQGKQIHALITKTGFGSDQYIQNALIHMYSEFGELGFAREVFDRMPLRDVVSWTSMIDGLVNADRHVDALALFDSTLKAGIEVNDATVMSVLRACAETGALSVGKKVHMIVKEKRIDSKPNVGTALVDMYAKSGCLESARNVFDNVVDKDVFVWTAMISALASHGMCQEAIGMFAEMETCRIEPDERTMTAVLSACRNSGLVNEAYVFLNDVPKRYGIEPTIQHFGCVVDLLARAGRLKEAEDFINTMPIKPDAVLWRTLIWACKLHGDTDRAGRLVKHLKLRRRTADDDSGSYILTSNVYASAGKWCNKAEVRELMNRRGLTKPPGCSRIEVDGTVCEFSMGDYNHPEAEKIYDKLDQIVDEIRKEGYNPRVSEVLLEMDDEDKAIQLLHHSEKLALAYGLIRNRQGSKIRIVKNLRSCEDCHEFMKLVSKIYQREIIVRDRIRFHHFKNGDCSCKDHW